MKRRTIREAAVEALKRSGHPLTVKALFSKIIEQDLYRFNAQDPAGVLKTQIRRHAEGINFPSANPKKYFQALTNGTYWIKGVSIPGHHESAAPEEVTKRDTENVKGIVADLKELQSKHTAAFKQQILRQLKEIDPTLFESFARKLLEVYGFKDMQTTKSGKDGGIDGHGKLKIGITELSVAFQCKRWRGNVGRVEVDKFRGASQGKFEYGMFFTTASFSKDALAARIQSGAIPIILIDGSTLVDIMIEKRFGVEIDSIPVYIDALDTAFTEE